MIEKINIFGKTYRIDCTEPRPIDSRTDHINQAIFISSDLSEECQNCALLGELISILSFKLDLELCNRQFSGLKEGLFSVGVKIPQELNNPYFRVNIMTHDDGLLESKNGQN